MQNEKTKKIKLGHKLAFGFVVCVLLGFILFFAIQSHNDSSPLSKLSVRNTVIQIEIAKTSQEQTRGLCCRDSLPENQGMLFAYDTPGDYGFWMKDTRIPLDMYWIDHEKKIVHIEHSVQPSSYPKSFRSPVPAQYVLETNAGFAKKHTIQVGDIVSF